jgi:pimeloyl-ACP methyl ester carboxylesterase
MISTYSQSIDVPGGFAPNPTLIRGEGDPLVYLHGSFGQEWSGFLDDLAIRHRVFAPAHPGTEEPADLQRLEGIFDLLLYYDDLFNSLELGKIDLVGHSFGGMVAAEFAAAFPHRVRRLVLIDALGLWRDDSPIGDYVMTSPEKQVSMLYTDPSRPEIAATLLLPEAKEERVSRMLHRFACLASTSHFIWPIPERGLARRLRRVKAETLLVWGKQDALAPVVYADEFAKRLAKPTVLVVDGAGHVPHVEQRAVVSRKMLEFLNP